MSDTLQEPHGGNRLRRMIATGMLIATLHGEAAPINMSDIPRRPEGCASLTLDDEMMLHIGEQQNADEGSGDTEPTVVGFVVHQITPGEEPDLRKIAECFFDDPDQGVKSLEASQPQRGENKFFVTLTSPLTIPRRGSAAALQQEVGLSTGLIHSALSRSRQAGLHGSVLPIQPKIEAPQGGELHYVTRGESLNAIAKAHGIKLSDLLALNNDTDTDIIHPGQILRIPAPHEVAKPLDITEQRKLAATSFIKQFGKTFKDTIGKDLPLDAVLAQAMKESQYGLSELAVNAHNFFGIKAGKDWQGETYTKRTSEVFPKTEAHKRCAQDPGCKIIRELPNGMTEIQISAVFRKYESLEAGIKDYMAKIRQQYPDVAKADAATYAKNLVDGEGPKWATDPNYAQGIDDIRVLLQPIIDSHINAPKTAEAPQDSADRLPTAPPERIPVSEKFMALVDSLQLSHEEYKKVIAGIFDASGLAASDPQFKGFTHIPSQPSDAEFVTDHFTAFLYGETEPDAYAMRILSSMSKRAGVGIQFSIMRDGTIVRFADPELRARPKHNPPYDNVSLGIEVESIDQDNITADQLKSLIYLNWMLLVKLGLQDAPLDTTVYGHSELREADGVAKYTYDPVSKRQGTLAVRSDFPTREMVALRELMTRAIAAGILPRG